MAQNPTASLSTMQAFDFTPDELALNRAGKISNRQARKLLRMMFVGLGCLAALSIPIAIMLVAIASSGLNNLSGNARSNAIFITVVFGAVVLVCLWAIVRTVADLVTKRCGTVRGSIDFVKTIHRGRTIRISYDIVLGGMKFPVKNEYVFGTMTRHGNYVAYYSSRTKYLLSIEQLTRS